MLPEMIVEFDAIVPAKSVLGYEFSVLKENLCKEKALFEKTPDKMAYDTSAYRRSNLAIERFLMEWLPKVRKAKPILEASSIERLSLFEHRSQFGGYEKHRISLGRRSEARIWQYYALECYREKLPRKMRRIKAYHPGIVGSLMKSWRTFRHEIQNWKYEHIKFDGSRAMHAMFIFIAKVDDLAAAHD